MLKRGCEPTHEDWRQEGALFFCVTGILFTLNIIFPRAWIVFVILFYGVFIVRSFTWSSILALKAHQKRHVLAEYIQEVKAGTKTPTHPILRFYVLTGRFDPRREIPSSEIVHPFWRFSSLAYRFIVMREVPRFETFFQDRPYSSAQEEQYSYQETGDFSSQEYDQEERFRRRQEQRRNNEEQKQRSAGRDENQERYSWCGILGITPETDYDTAKKAHRDLLKKYHPDHVNHLGPEFQELATQRFKEIHGAWEAFERHWKLKNS